MPAKQNDELVFLPLGGAGEIGMNLYLYGYGPPRARQWLMVDLGVTFGGPNEPGVDVILPDTGFIEAERANLVGILLTHCHEDHFGAVADLWPRLGADVYATPFTAGLLRAKLIERGGSEDMSIRETPLQSRLEIGPFDVELVTVAHSIPEPNAVVIRTPAGTIVHSGDWKLDRDPIVGPPTDAARLQEIGAEGVGALVCDSTNALRDGVSPSEADVAHVLAGIIARAERRVAVTTFASNVARLRSVIAAARAADRHVVIVGRAMHRILQVARETGYLDEGTELLGEEDYGYLPRDKVVALCTGSQGESRAALARIATDEHPHVTLSSGDMVIFSSRTIPGNGKDVARVQNDLADIGVEIITDADAPVHVSGHPRRGELEQMYEWIRPEALIPMHGEPLHLHAHAEFARACGIPRALPARNGTMIRLLPGPAEIVDEAPAGRLYRDGRLLVQADAGPVRERRKLSFVGAVTVALALTRKGEVVADPQVALFGVPLETAGGRPFAELARDAALGALDGIPRPRRKDPELVREAVRRAVRAEVGAAWGKKPLCAVMVTVV